MKTLDEIKQAELEISRVKTLVEATDRTREIKKLNKQIQLLNFDQDTDVMNILRRMSSRII